MTEPRLNIAKIVGEIIGWIDVNDGLPDAGTEVLVCYERNDCDERGVTIATFDDEDDGSPWWVDGGLTCFGTVLYWSQMPNGPELAAATLSEPTEVSNVPSD